MVLCVIVVLVARDMRFCSSDGVRYRAGFARSVFPLGADTNESFERYPETMARRLEKDCNAVELEFMLSKEASGRRVRLR